MPPLFVDPVFRLLSLLIGLDFTRDSADLDPLEVAGKVVIEGE